MSDDSAAARRATGRRIFLRIHQTVGLILGAFFVLIGLSGAVLAYREDLDEWLNAPMLRLDPPPEASLRPLDELLAAAVAAMPQGAQVESVTPPRHEKAAATIRYMAETDDLDSVFYEIFVDPYRAKVLGQRIFLRGDSVLSQPPIQILMAFHWTLLLGVNNAYVVGVIGAFMFGSVLVGLYLWLPRNGGWRLAFAIKWGASPERIVHDLHRSVGVFSSVLLLAMLASGVAMIFKPATREIVARFSPVRADPDFGKSQPPAGRPPVSLEAAAAVAAAVFPEGNLQSILLPGGPTGVYVVGRRSADEPNRSRTYRNVSVDQYSGAVLKAQNRAEFTAGERFLEWLYPLHSGEAFGAIGRPILALIGMTPLILYATGFLRWRQKRRARRRR